MKKILMLLLMVMSMVSISGCAGGKDPSVVYDEATKKTSELTSLDASSKINIQMTQGEEKFDMVMDLDMKMVDINTDSMKYLAQGKTSVGDQDMDILMYYENGYTYMDTMGQKMKYAIDLDGMMKQIKQSTESANLDSSLLKKISSKKDGDNTILSYTVDAQKMDTYVQDMMGQMGTNFEDAAYVIKDASGESTVTKDGYISKAKVKMSMEMTLEGETVAMVMDMDYTYNNPGQTVEITAPDLEGYTEVDAGALGLQ